MNATFRSIQQDQKQQMRMRKFIGHLHCADIFCPGVRARNTVIKRLESRPRREKWQKNSLYFLVCVRQRCRSLNTNCTGMDHLISYGKLKNFFFMIHFTHHLFFLANLFNWFYNMKFISSCHYEPKNRSFLVGLKPPILV